LNIFSKFHQPLWPLDIADRMANITAERQCAEKVRVAAAGLIFPFHPTGDIATHKGTQKRCFRHRYSLPRSIGLPISAQTECVFHRQWSIERNDSVMNHISRCQRVSRSFAQLELSLVQHALEHRFGIRLQLMGS
jgi:hypothetical protein